MKTRKYLSRSILPCSYAESTRSGMRWYVESLHSTGIPYGEMDSHRFRSLRAAREWIRESAAAHDTLAPLTPTHLIP